MASEHNISQKNGQIIGWLLLSASFVLYRPSPLGLHEEEVWLMRKEFLADERQV